MALTLEPTKLDAPFGDSEGILAKRDGRLFAVLSCLGDLHGELLGQWYVEATFSSDLIAAGRVFLDLASFEADVARRFDQST